MVFTSNRTGVFEVWVSASDGSSPSKLTNLPDSLSGSPRWRSDGKQIVFFSDRNNAGYQDWIINRDGSSLQQITQIDRAPWNPILFPDGKKLSFTSSKGTFLIDLSKPLSDRLAEPLPLMDKEGHLFDRASCSSDGRYMAGFCVDSNLSRIPGLFVYTLQTKAYTKIAEAGQSPTWVASSSKLLFQKEQDLYIVDVVSNKVQHVSTKPDVLMGPVSVVDVSRDGKFLYLVREDSQADIWLATLQE